MIITDQTPDTVTVELPAEPPIGSVFIDRDGMAWQARTAWQARVLRGDGRVTWVSTGPRHLFAFGMRPEDGLTPAAEDRRLDELTVKARFRAANLLLDDNPERANELLTEALAAADPAWPVRASILNNRGITWRRLDHPELAFDDFSAAITSKTATNEMRASSYNNRADLLAERDPVGSIADRTAVLGLSDTTFNRRFVALIRRARTLFLTGDSVGALADIDTILTSEDIVPEQKMAARLQRAEWLLENGLPPSDATPDLMAVIASKRNFDYVLSRAGLLLAKITSPTA